MAKVREFDSNLKTKSAVRPHEDPFIALGGNAAGVLKGHVEGLEKEEEAIVAIRARKKERIAKAKADGFSAKALNVILRKRKVDEAVRLLEEEEVRKMEEALGMPTLFDYAKQNDGTSASERDADAGMRFGAGA